MRILCIQHADFETTGTIEQWASNNGHSFKIEKPYRGEQLPETGDFDMLISMGGPQSALRITEFPFLQPEIALIRAAFSTNKKILGFCLGAQLIGEALGARTETSPEKEIGVYPISLTAEGTNDALLKGLPRTIPVIHWHSEMPGMTKKAAILASSPGCPRQIVRYGNNAYGFQCHMEITLDGIKTMMQAVPEDLRPSRFTQSHKELLDNDYSSINACLVTILDRFAEVGMLASAKLQTIVWSSRMAEAEEFYGQVLGLPLKGKSHGAAVYDVGGSDLRVSPVPSTQPSAHTVVGFSVADIAATVAMLTKRGVSLERIAGLPQDSIGILRALMGRRLPGSETRMATCSQSFNMRDDRKIERSTGALGAALIVHLFALFADSCGGFAPSFARKLSSTCRYLAGSS